MKASRIFLLVVLSAVSLDMSPALQDPQIIEYQKKLSDIAKKIDELNSIIAREEKKKDSILATMDTIALRKELARRQINLYSTQLDQANREISQTQKRISTLQSTLNNQKDSIVKVIITLYKFGAVNYMDLFFQAKDVGSLIAENKHLTVLAKTQADILNNYLGTLKELNKAETLLQDRKGETARLLQNSRRKQTELANQEKESRRMIQRINNDRQLYERRKNELNQQHTELQNLLKDIIAQQPKLPFNPSPLYDKKGRLDWPIEGRVVTKFGPKRHPKFNTTTISNGIEISPRSDTVIKAVHPGIVRFVDYMPYYGKLIILDHGLKYYTLYGHCSDTLVTLGEVISPGQAIAYVGDIGSLEGKTLYFGIRNGTTPLDPLQWLKRR